MKKVKELEFDLAKERKMRSTLVEGEVRALRTHYERAVLDREEAERRKAAAERKCKHFRKIAEATDERVVELVEILAEATSTNAKLTAHEQARLKREAVEARARERHARSGEREHARELQVLRERAEKAEELARHAEELADMSKQEA